MRSRPRATYLAAGLPAVPLIRPVAGQPEEEVPPPHRASDRIRDLSRWVRTNHNPETVFRFGRIEDQRGIPISLELFHEERGPLGVLGPADLQVYQGRVRGGWNDMAHEGAVLGHRRRLGCREGCGNSFPWDPGNRKPPVAPTLTEPSPRGGRDLAEVERYDVVALAHHQPRCPRDQWQVRAPF